MFFYLFNFVKGLFKVNPVMADQCFNDIAVSILDDKRFFDQINNIERYRLQGLLSEYVLLAETILLFESRDVNMNKFKCAIESAFSRDSLGYLLERFKEKNDSFKSHPAIVELFEFKQNRLEQAILTILSSEEEFLKFEKSNKSNDLYNLSLIHI